MGFSRTTVKGGNVRKVPNATLANVHRRKQTNTTQIVEMDVFQAFFVFFAICFTLTNALMFHLSPNSKKCLKEEIHKDVLVAGEYELSESPGQKFSIAVCNISKFLVLLNNSIFLQ